MNFWILNSFFVIFLIKNIISHDAKDFDDSILYNIEWGEPKSSKLEVSPLESILVTSEDQYKYHCTIPKVQKQARESNNDLELLVSPVSYLSSIFSLAACNFRIEAYWTYEICHGYYVKQFHEDRDGKVVKVQEFYLGKWNEVKTEELKKSLLESGTKNVRLNTVKIENYNFPYVEIDMVGGTYCELNNGPRSIRVKYVCFLNKNNEIYSIKETSTCQYEMIVMTSVLCDLPAFNTEKTEEAVIQCSNTDNAPPVPQAIVESDWTEFVESQGRLLDIVFAMSRNLGNQGAIDSLPHIYKTPAPKDTFAAEEFLSGATCLTGGSGWWKYEFCFGKQVRQIHYEKNLEVVSVNLGVFDKDAHLKWMEENPDKKPKSKELRTEVSHFYQGGEICLQTNEMRKTEVKLKCAKNGYSSTAVSMYLLEPKTCEYNLVVEAAVICDILPRVNDDTGLINNHSEP